MLSEYDKATAKGMQNAGMRSTPNMRNHTFTAREIFEQAVRARNRYTYPLPMRPMPKVGLVRRFLNFCRGLSK